MIKPNLKNSYWRIAAIIIGAIVFFYMLSYGMVGILIIWTAFMFCIATYILVNLPKFRAVIAEYDKKAEEEQKDDSIIEIQKKQELARIHKNYDGDPKYLQEAIDKMKSRKPNVSNVWREKKAK